MIVPMSTNPIQEVLAAEREAGQQVEAARGEAERVIAQARRRARTIRSRNDERTRRALAGYERAQNERRENAATELRMAAAEEFEQYESLVSGSLDELIERTFRDFWPD
jgi:vacuolar-type H+-ATPase subunit H